MQPLITPLLAEAQRRGNPVCTGNGMLEHQLAAFSKFLGFLPLDGAVADASLKDLE
jgi:shikimate 5-dehydrogenase